MNGTKIQVDPSTFSLEDPTSLLAEINYIPLETQTGNYIGMISKIIPFSETFFLMNGPNHTKVMAFSSEGKFLFEINAQGRGPGEYGELGDFLLDKKNNRLALLDRFGKVLFYDLAGNFLSETPIEFTCSEFTALPHGGFACNSGSRNFYEGKPVMENLFFLDENLKITHKLIPPMGTQDAVVNHKGRLTMMNPNGLLMFWMLPTIFEVSEFAATPLYTFDFGEFNIPNEILTQQTYDEMETEMDELEASKYVKIIYQLVEEEHVLSCLIFWKEGLRQVLVHKKSLANLVLPTFHVQEEVYVPPICRYEDQFLGVIQAHELLEHSADKTLSPRLQKITENLSETDNPILISYTYAPDLFSSKNGELR